MISFAAIPAVGRKGGQTSSSRRAQAAKAFSSARSAAESGGVAMAVLVLVVTGARDQRRRLRSAALDILVGRSDRCCFVRAPNAIDASTTPSAVPSC